MADLDLVPARVVAPDGTEHAHARAVVDDGRLYVFTQPPKIARTGFEPILAAVAHLAGGITRTPQATTITDTDGGTWTIDRQRGCACTTRRLRQWTYQRPEVPVA